MRMKICLTQEGGPIEAICIQEVFLGIENIIILHLF